MSFWLWEFCKHSVNLFQLFPKSKEAIPLIFTALKFNNSCLMESYAFLLWSFPSLLYFRTSTFTSASTFNLQTTCWFYSYGYVAFRTCTDQPLSSTFGCVNFNTVILSLAFWHLTYPVECNLSTSTTHFHWRRSYIE